MIFLALFLLVMLVFCPHIVFGVIGMYIAVYGTAFIIGQIAYFLEHGKFASLSKDDSDSRPYTEYDCKLDRIREDYRHYWDPNHRNYQLDPSDPKYKRDQRPWWKRWNSTTK
jgi:hypothetical protein